MSVCCRQRKIREAAHSGVTNQEAATVLVRPTGGILFAAHFAVSVIPCVVGKFLCLDNRDFEIGFAIILHLVSTSAMAVIFHKKLFAQRAQSFATSSMLYR